MCLAREGASARERRKRERLAQNGGRSFEFHLHFAWRGRRCGAGRSLAFVFGHLIPSQFDGPL